MSKTPINNKKLVDSDRLSEALGAVKTYVDSNKVSRLRDPDTGISISELFFESAKGDASLIRDLTYASWSDNLSAQSIIYDYQTFVDFFFNVQEGTLYSETVDSFGGDKRLVYVSDVEYNYYEDYKQIYCVVIGTYMEAPVTLSITISGKSHGIDSTEISAFLSTDEFEYPTTSIFLRKGFLDSNIDWIYLLEHATGQLLTFDYRTTSEAIKDFGAACSFIAYAKGDEIDFVNMAGYGGSRMLAYIYLTDQTTDTKEIQVALYPTTTFLPATFTIGLQGLQAAKEGQVSHCTINICKNDGVQGEYVAASTKYVQDYVDTALNGLATRKFGG